MKTKIKIEFIINPIAGTRSKVVFKDLISKYLDSDKYTYQISYTRAGGHAFELASEAVKEGKDYVVAVGGDGTVNETASALIHQSSALGIIPVGSGNGLARHLGIPLNPVEAIKALNNVQKKLIDAGTANGKPFFCTAGIGFDAHIGRMFSLATKRGFNTYIKTVLREFLTYNSQTYQVSINNEETITKEAFSITFANAAQFGNNAYISPEADIADGKLDLCIIEKYPKRVGLHLGLRLFNKTIHKSRFMTIKQIDKAVIKCPNAECYHLDGEFLPLKGDLNIEVVPGSLNVLTPKV